MAKPKEQYKCSKCGKITSKWGGQCSFCKEWNTLEAYEETAVVSSPGGKIQGTVQAKQMKDITISERNRVLTGIDEFDRVVGGGLVDDSVSIISAIPGTGKSTLCMSLCNNMVKLGKTAYYASGEESQSQLKSRAMRMNLDCMDKIYVSDTTCMDDVIETALKIDADFIIADSIQAFYLKEHLPSRPGNPTQVIECASILLNIAKRHGKPRMVIIVGQMNKDDELAGHRALEHLVDTVLIMDGNRDDVFRMLFSTKNRFGDIGEIGFFQMTGEGLLSVENPSEYFLTERDMPVMGTALTVLKEGSRPIIIEIESLVTKSFTSFPTRISEVMNKDRLNVMISILEQHCGMNFYDKNVTINTQNNIRLKSSDINLAVIMSIVSSYYKKPLPLNSVFLADVGLTGELKKLPNIEMRLKELDRMGYGEVFISKNACISVEGYKNISIKKFGAISEVLDYLDMKRHKKEETANKNIENPV